LAALAGFVLVCVAALAISECAWASACGGLPWAAIGVGLALALSVVVWMHRTAALILAAAAAASWWFAMREVDVPAWVTVSVALLVGGAAIMALIPWRDAAQWPDPTAGQSRHPPRSRPPKTVPPGSRREQRWPRSP
jgi:hypothetical protein